MTLGLPRSQWRAPPEHYDPQDGLVAHNSAVCTRILIHNSFTGAGRMLAAALRSFDRRTESSGESTFPDKGHTYAELMNKVDVKSKVSMAEVKAKIEEALRRSAKVDARRMYVSAQNRTVTLEGNVRSLFEKQQAERAACSAPGVSRVIDNIAVAP